MKRATAEDIHKHEWFQKDLPTYLFPDRDVDVAIMDHETVGVVCEVNRKYCMVLYYMESMSWTNSPEKKIFTAIR